MNNNNFSQIITEKFSNKFIASYKALKGRGKTKILKYSPIIFKRWYYSTLINETTLSPSFIYGASLGVNSAVTALSVRPEVAGTSFRGFSVKENRYTISNHPVVNDLRTLLDFCIPDVELDSQDRIISTVCDKLGNFLSLGDPCYIEYLTAIAFELRLLKKSDAIYSNKAVISNNYTLFRKLYQEEALKKIVDASIKLCSKKINGALPQPVPFVSVKGITSLIKKPVAIDEIFKKVFGTFGVNIEELWRDYSENLPDMDGEQNIMLSSTFFLGILLDKWFITPFGEYLKLIEPIYCFCYNFDEELGYLHDTIKSGGIVDTALFSPCAFYSFTPFGRMFFASVPFSEKGKAPTIPVSDLLELLNYDAEPERFIFNDRMLTTKEVYSFKVKLFEDKRYWKQIDAANYNTLHDLHLEIALNFSFGLTNYRIFTDDDLNPFSEFIGPKSKGKKRKAAQTALEELNLNKGKKMIYFSETGKKIEIELIKRTPDERKDHFPQTVRMSKLLRMKELGTDSKDY